MNFLGSSGHLPVPEIYILVKIEMPEDTVGVQDILQLGNAFFQEDDIPFSFIQCCRQVIYELKGIHIFFILNTDICF